MFGKTEHAEKGGGGGGRHSFDAVRESLKQLSSTNAAQNEKKSAEPLSLSALRNTLKLRPAPDSSTSTANRSSRVRVVGGTETMPFGRESREKKDGQSSAATRTTEFMKIYSFGELGEKLRKLRPAAKGEFSLEEFNDRLMKLREMEEKEAETKVAGFSFNELRKSLVKLQQNDTEKKSGKLSDYCV